MGGEGACVDRNPQPRPEMPDGADMILVRMGEEYAFEPVPALFQPSID